jgi:hypothetical protein
VPVAMLLDDAAAEPSPLCPDPSHEKGRRWRGQHLDPPLLLLPLCKLPTIVPSLAPTHSIPQPRPKPSSTRARPSRPMSPMHIASMPCAGHPLDAPVPDAMAYKNPPPIKRGDAHHSQLPPRDTHLSPLALARRRQPHRRGTGREGRPRIWPQGSMPTPGIGGEASPESFLPIAIKLCFLYTCRRRHHLIHCV